jgi:HK97 family phage major capsid protein
VRLTAKKIGVLTKYTRELNEDAVINIGDDLAGEIAYAFGAFEDDCGFNGTARQPTPASRACARRLVTSPATRDLHPQRPVRVQHRLP